MQVGGCWKLQHQVILMLHFLPFQNFTNKHGSKNVEVWMASTLGTQTMLSIMNLSHKNASPQVDCVCVCVCVCVCACVCVCVCMCVFLDNICLLTHIATGGFLSLQNFL